MNESFVGLMLLFKVEGYISYGGVFRFGEGDVIV